MPKWIERGDPNCKHRWFIDSEGIARCQVPGCGAVRDESDILYWNDSFYKERIKRILPRRFDDSDSLEILDDL